MGLERDGGGLFQDTGLIFARCDWGSPWKSCQDRR